MAKRSRRRVLAARALLVSTRRGPGIAWARDPVPLAVEDDWTPFVAARRDPQGVDGLAVDFVTEAQAPQRVHARLLDDFHWHRTLLFHAPVQGVGKLSVDGFWGAFTKIWTSGATGAGPFHAGLETLVRSGRNGRWSTPEDAWRKISAASSTWAHH